MIRAVNHHQIFNQRAGYNLLKMLLTSYFFHEEKMPKKSAKSNIQTVLKNEVYILGEGVFGLAIDNVII